MRTIFFCILSVFTIYLLVVGIARIARRKVNGLTSFLTGLFTMAYLLLKFYRRAFLATLQPYKLSILDDSTSLLTGVIIVLGVLLIINERKLGKIVNRIPK